MDSIVTYAALIAAVVFFLVHFFVNDYGSYRNDKSIDVPRYTSLDASFKCSDKRRYHK